MKQYQKNWIKRLEQGDDGETLNVCREICDDDTGCTDELTMELARKLILKFHDEKWIGWEPPLANRENTRKF